MGVPVDFVSGQVDLLSHNNTSAREGLIEGWRFVD